MAIADGFTKIIHRGDRVAVVAHDCGWLFVEERRPTDLKERHAEVCIAEMMPDGVTYKSRHKVCDVWLSRQGWRPDSKYVPEVNWSAWGSRDPETTRRFAECLLAATELCEAFSEGFTFLPKEQEA